MPPKYKIKRVEKADTRQVEEVKIEVIDLVSEESNREEPLDFQQEDEDMNEDDSEYNEDDDDDEDFEIEYRHKAPLTRRNLDNEAPPLAPEDLIENSTFVSVSRRNLNNYAVDSQRSRYYPMNYGVCRSGFNKSSYEAKIVNDAKFIVNDIPDEPMPVFFHAKSLNQLELVNELFTELEHVREMNNEKARGLLKRKTKSKTNIPIENFYFFIGSRQVKLVEPSSNNQNEEFKLSNGKQLDFSAAELYLYKSTFKYSTQSNRFWCFRNAIAVENVYPSYLDPTQQEYFIYSYFADKKLLLKLNDHSELLRSLLTLYTTHSIELIFKIDEEFNLNIDIYLNSVFKNDNLVADPSSYYLHKNYKNLNFVISSMFSLDHFVGYTTADYENELNSASNQKSIKNENLFDLVYKIHNDKRYELNEQQMAEIQCKSGLKSALRPYQLKAINWMLARERQNEQLFDDENDNIHPLYVQLTNKYNESIYYNKFDGVFSSIKPTTLKSLPGGILADEMGLGKTVEILALIQMNKRVDFPNTSNDLIFEQEPKRIKKAAFSCSCGNTPDYFRTDIYKNKVSLDLSSIYECVGCGVFSHFKCVNYNGKKSKFLCLHCCSKRKPIPSRATLIITPAVISHQWADEIKKHVKSSLKVLIYKGTQNGFIQPDDLAEYDVVIATYDALSSELSHVFAIENMRELRHSKRFMNIPSPLICVEWWRICLDEAQMVHSTNTRCAEMANRMFAVNRWCVSGTPIGKSLADLHGLFMFIREDPYYEKKWFYETLFAPYISGNKVPMTNAVARVLWRTSKHFVEDQINIPKQTEKIFWLDFSPFEAHLYERVLENFRLNRHGSFQNDVLFDEQFFQNCDKELVLDELDRKIIDKILSPILDLRLACNHPQLILRKKSFMAQNNGFRKEKILTIEKSIEMLLKKTQNECENALRLITMNKNALAGLNIISSDYAEAIQIYQSILHSEKVYESNVRLDKVQKVHTCFNYLSILRMTASEDKEKIEWLTNELSACEKAYMVSFDEAKQKNQEKLTEKSNEIKKHLSKNANNYLYKWWIDALDRIESSSKFEEFWSKLANYFSFDPTVNAHKTKETTNNVSIGSAYIVCGKSVKSINELKLVLANQLDNVIEHRNEVKSKLDSFSNEISSDVVAAVADCHLRREMFESKKNATNNKNNNKNKNVNDIEESPNENKSRPLCAICKCDNLLKKYAHSLFSKSDESIKQFANQINEGEDEDNEANEKFHSNQLMNSSDLQNCLKVIHYCCRGEQEHNEKTNPGKDSLEFYTMLCEEYNIFVRYWMSVSHQIGALDELEMVKTRMRLLQPDEKNIYNYEYIIEPRMVQIHFYKYKNDLNTSQYDLKKKLGQLLFLKNLQKSHLVQTGQENTDICPICQCNLGTDWYMLSCGHSYCKECLAAIKKNENHVNITCPMCRETIDVKNEAYLVTAKKLTFDQESDQEKTQLLNQNDSNDFEYGNNAKELEKIKIIGECNSAKVEGVVKCLISILTKDKLSKCIVFSEHSTILELIASLLKPNLIVFKLAKDPSSLKTCINEFKEKANLNVLLMPYHLGANGLNIIEATHVLLVEPTLNKSQEVQAIGRVHRIGQTKPTYVYRFHIRNTIEELVYKLFNKSSKTYQTNSSKANSSKHFEQAENSSYGEKGFSIEDLRNLYAQL